jgi:DNA topoisomerase-2
MSSPKYTQLSNLEHAKRRTMWTGSKSKQSVELFIFDEKTGKISMYKLAFAPALQKIVDEVIVNAIDHHTNNRKTVSEIKISFDKNTKRITCYNDGPGIPVLKTKNLNGLEMYIPQMIASEFLSGSNLDESEDQKRKTGGLNGAGLKLANALSKFMSIETVDMKNNKYYYQEFEDGINTIHKPIVKSAKANKYKKSFTQIVFEPDYIQHFGYPGGLSDVDIDCIYRLIQTRAYQAGAFCSCRLFFNGSEVIFDRAVPRNTFAGFVGLFNPGEVFKTILKYPNDSDLSWEVLVSVSNKKYQQFSIVNGVYVYNGGTHMKHLKEQIVNGIQPKAEKIFAATKSQFNKNYIANNLFIFMKGFVKGPEFTGQVKDKLSNPIKTFKPYKFTKSNLDKIWDIISPSVLEGFLENKKEKDVKRINRGTVNVYKCEDARLAGSKKHSKDCFLFICEGDSAIGTVHTAIVNKATKLGGYDKCGTFSIQGVPINARKKITKFVNDGKSTIIRNADLVANERLTSLVKVLGLDYNRKYEEQSDIDTLRYGYIVAATDQDDDGKGNIFGLLLNFFALFWPALVKRGYVKRLNTPIIRAFPKKKGTKKNPNKILTFYSISKYEEFVASNYKSKGGVDDDYRVSYFKGLGTHKKHYIPYMFRDIKTKLITIVWDVPGENNLENMYGKIVLPRKTILSTPVSSEYADTTQKNITVTEQLMIDTKAYMLDNIKRKLPHTIDGLNPARRSLLYGAMLIFKQTNKEMKLEVFVNRVCTMTNYHHGASSLCGTAARMAQSFAGSNNIPFIYDDGNYGTRKMGGSDFASPRYTETHLNKRLVSQMFPDADFSLLPQRYDEGEHVGPEYFIPIIPYVLLENIHLPANAWSVNSFARDFKEVISNIRDLINGKIFKARPMKYWKNKFTGRVIINEETGKTWTVGTYSAKLIKKTNEILFNITELPVGIFSNTIGKSRKSREKIDENTPIKPKSKNDPPEMKAGIIGKPSDETNDESVAVTIRFTNDTKLISEIKKNYGDEVTDCWEAYFGLRSSLSSNINYIGENGSVVEYKTYEDVLDNWFGVRKVLYGDRIKRQITLLELRVRCLENIIRFSKTYEKYKITTNMDLKTAEATLTTDKYDKFDKTFLNDPKFTKTSQIKKLALFGINSSYTYLLDMRMSDMLKSRAKTREEKLVAMKLELKRLSLDNKEDTATFPGKNTWLSELSDLEETIDLGLKIGWRYGSEKDDLFE